MFLDIDECCSGPDCDGSSHSCQAPATCNNVDGGYSCECPDGWMNTAEGLGCTGKTNSIWF